MRTYPADGARKRDLLADQLNGLAVMTGSDQSHIALAVCLCRTLLGARRAAVTHMVGQKQLQVCLSGLPYPVCLRMYHHTRCNLCGTCLQKLRIALHLHDTDAAGTVYFHPLVITEGRNVNIILSGSLQNGLSRKCRDFFSVYINSVLFYHLAPPTVLLLHGTGIPLRTCRT